MNLFTRGDIARITYEEGEDQTIQINMFYEFSTLCRNIEVRNMRGAGAKIVIKIRGLMEQKLKNILLEDICLEADIAMECSNVEKLLLNNVELKEN